jgi:hypothetical protein
VQRIQLEDGQDAHRTQQTANAGDGETEQPDNDVDRTEHQRQQAQWALKHVLFLQQSVGLREQSLDLFEQAG